MKRTLRRRTGTLTTACLWLAVAGPALAQSGAEVSRDLSLVTHNAVVIAAKPERIWPYIVDPDAWKAGARLLHDQVRPVHAQGLVAQQVGGHIARRGSKNAREHPGVLQGLHRALGMVGQHRVGGRSPARMPGLPNPG